MNTIEQDEGLKLSLYKDTEGYWTIGIGHLVTKNPDKSVALSLLDQKFSRHTNGVITKEEGYYLFNNDASAALKSLDTMLKENQIEIDPVRKEALLNMTFQLGIQGLKGFKNSLAMIKQKMYNEAAINLAKSKWYKQTPNRAKRVISVIRTGTFDGYK